MSDLKKRLYNLFDPDPCEAELYVSLDEARGSAGLVERLADDIRLSDNSVCKLLAGHRGSGKSTELLRLKQELEGGEEKHFVVLFDAVKDRNIDPLDADFPELLIAVIAHLADDLRKHLDTNLKPGYLKRLFGDIGSILTSTVDFSSVELSAGLIKLSGALTKNADLRRVLRGEIGEVTDQWINATNSIIDDAQVEINKKGYASLVVIVDGLDKIIMNRDPQERSCAEKLFHDWNVQLRSLNCHMLYTIPIALAYSSSERSIASNFGLTAPPVIPMTKLFDSNGDETEGFRKFSEIIKKRVALAGGDTARVFENGEATINKLVGCSGGQPRELMVLIRGAMLGGDLPIKDEAIEAAARDITNAYSRQLWQEHWEEIEFVKTESRLDRSSETERICMDLLDMRAVLQYKNGEEWYGLNPLLPENPEETSDEGE